MDHRNEQRLGMRGAVRLGAIGITIALALVACERIIGIPERQNQVDASAGKADGGSTPDGGSTATQAKACEEYCSAAASACSSAPTQAYESDKNCRGTCEHLPLGKSSDPTGNTVFCRRDQAMMANLSEGQPTHCPAASPGGQGDSAEQCGTNCQAYCALWDSVCAKVGIEADFAGDCEERCPVIYDRGAFNAHTDFSAKDDTIQCRLAHLTAAAGYAPDKPDRAKHCHHAQLRPPRCPGESPPCDLQPDMQPDVPADEQARVPLCQKYCFRMQKTCTTELKIYDDETQCQRLCERAFDHNDASQLKKNSAAETDPTACELLPDTGSDSLECRYWHVDAAWFEADTTHCLHAGPDGGGHCGGEDPCVVYCSLLQKGCRDFDAEFASTSLDPAKECARSCNALDRIDYDLLLSSRLFEDTYECRLHNLVTLIAGDDFKAGGVDSCKDRAVYPASGCPQ